MSHGGPIDNPQPADPNSGDDIVRALLIEILRVKELIKHYDTLPGDKGAVSAALLTELVAEAYNSLINYDLELMVRYHDLLQHSD